jgi:hypothetical protein
LGRVLGRRVVLGGVFAVYAALTLWVGLHHEPWRDEADTWLLMRDASPAEVLRYASWGGTPLLFHLTILPFARSGLPYLSQQLLVLLYAWGAVWLVLRSPAFPAPVKLLFPFSFYPSFEYSVVARPYALFMLLLFLMAAQWRTREEKPVRLAIAVALLANVTMHGLLIVAIAGLLLLVERIRDGTWRRHLTPFAIMVLGGLLSVAQLWPRAGGQVVSRSPDFGTLSYLIGSAFFPDRQLPELIPAAIVFVLIAIGVSRRAVPLSFLLLTVGAMLAVFLYVWTGGTRHAGILFLLSVAALWIAHAYGDLRLQRVVMIAFAISLAWSAVTVSRFWLDDLRFPFSGGRWMAGYIRRAGLETAQIGAGQSLWNSPLVDLPKTRIWFPESRDWGTFATWAFHDKTLTEEQAIRRTQDHFRGQRWYLLTNRPVPPSMQAEFELMARSPLQWGPADERYYLYEPVR